MGLVRLMQLGDLQQILTLEQKHQLHPWPKEAFQQALYLKQYCVVFEEDGIIQAYGVADKGHGRTICAESIEGADAIYQAWFNHGLEQKAPEFYAEIELENRAARIRLKRFGFKVQGQIPNFYGVGSHGERWARLANEPIQARTQQNEPEQVIEPHEESA